MYKGIEWQGPFPTQSHLLSKYRDRPLSPLSPLLALLFLPLPVLYSLSLLLGDSFLSLFLLMQLQQQNGDLDFLVQMQKCI